MNARRCLRVSLPSGSDCAGTGPRRSDAPGVVLPGDCCFRGQLASGQDIWITYDPPEGTHIRHSGKAFLVTRDHGLMDAVLDVWLDDTPVSHDVRRTLLAALRK